jgi:hypothetical protein
MHCVFCLARGLRTLTARNAVVVNGMSVCVGNPASEAHFRAATERDTYKQALAWLQEHYPER